MAEHDFRRTALNPSHTLIECRTLGAGLFQVTGQGGGVRSGDELICTIKGSKDLPMRLTVDKIRYLINPPGQWTASARGPDLRGQSVLGWSITCDECGREQPFEFLAADRDDLNARTTKAVARISELGWQPRGDNHLCPACARSAAALKTD
ncbi:hypothetical protein [Pseudomonas abyssi]|uniref:Uncharacterized protein n=1 Tax=Pseudomonas abyssi TaxID=170540 RepID=A0A395R3K0_9PSED|nr:hypothetical protein [Halopseudomonas gallaeciensis]MAG64258.1 hypothetical protein [Pseudomonadales bacterium]RGP54379.1 hypothetical protein ASB58_10870 [Halopseudomonas gallaeciensis]|tara:strand:+ start:327 stop:779 length:453 start_codon:yes stop_codon:yes gene_type:complete